MEALRRVTLFFRSRETVELMNDHTLYQITTRANTFCGYIMYQDSIMMKLQTTEGKPVKILKENICEIKILLM